FLEIKVVQVIDDLKGEIIILRPVYRLSEVLEIPVLGIHIAVVRLVLPHNIYKASRSKLPGVYSIHIKDVVIFGIDGLTGMFRRQQGTIILQIIQLPWSHPAPV